METKAVEVMQYLDHYDDYSQLKSRIESLNNLNKYAYTLHDKDIADNGELKKPHFHCVITFHNNNTFECIAKTLKIETQYVNKIKAKTSIPAFRYLIHFGQPDKYQYKPDEVTANFDYIAFISKQKCGDDFKLYGDMIVNGEIREYNYTSKIPPHVYAMNKTKFDNFFKYRRDKLNLERRGNRDMECVYICGSAGVGKTTFAKQYAEKNGYSYFVSSGGNKPLDDYRGEDCIILDDLRGDDKALSFVDLLKLTDNNTDSFVGCRYYNKSILECKLVIATSVSSITQLFDYVCEDKTQLYRRFQTMIKMEDKTLNIYQYNDAIRGYEVYMENVPNPIWLVRQASKVNHPLAQKLLEFANEKALSEDIKKQQESESEYANMVSLPIDEKPFSTDVFEPSKA